MSAPYAAESRIEDAVRILSHYFAQGGSGVDRDSLRDLHAEMRDVVELIVDAAVLTIEAERDAVKERAP